jgi:hypothetical protein
VCQFVISPVEYDMPSGIDVLRYTGRVHLSATPNAVGSSTPAVAYLTSPIRRSGASAAEIRRDYGDRGSSDILAPPTGMLGRGRSTAATRGRERAKERLVEKRKWVKVTWMRSQLRSAAK